jgi:hypothetical protein
VKSGIASVHFNARPRRLAHRVVEARMKQVLGTKQAAIEAGVFTQQVYQAIAHKLLDVERRGGRVFIRRESFERWKANLQTRRRMRIEEQQAQEART